ncbi:CU044_2847 family protein [Streptomyces sp. NPDC058614]|uniref:CU044_2847 family protein n=1 Tax=Streptomyces sp. NPDC058614 TaxID=3346557 RepID=UPI00364A412B
MGDGVTRIARIEMPDGTPVWARISGAEELEAPSGGLSYTDTGFGERIEAQVESLQSVITSVARSLAAPLRAVRPDEVSVEFGIELTAKAGKVIGLLADGEAKGGLTVTLTWNGGPPDLDPVAGGGDGPVINPVAGGGDGPVINPVDGGGGGPVIRPVDGTDDGPGLAPTDGSAGSPRAVPGGAPPGAPAHGVGGDAAPGGRG